MLTILTTLIACTSVGSKGETSDTSAPSPVDDSASCEEGLWYPDADGDGYGDAFAPTAACEAPEDLIADGTDCDDADPTVYLGAEERCGDGAVNDCDDASGTAAAELCQDPGPYTLRGADTILIGEEAEQRAGWPVANAGDTDGDGLSDLLVAATLATNHLGGTGIVYLVRGPKVDSPDLGDSAAQILAYATIGTFLGDAGDLDGDGYADVWVTGMRSGPTGSGEGSVWLLPGPLDGEQVLSLAETTFAGEPHEHAGSSVATVGDVNADGWEDVLVGAPDAQGAVGESDLGYCATTDWTEFYYEDGVSAGAAYLLLGPISGGLTPEDATARFVGEDGGDGAGQQTQRVGDLDGDGRPDLAFTAYRNCQGAVDAGALYLQYGEVSGEMSLADADAKLMGTDSWQRAGQTMASAGDADGDGRDDLLIGAPEDVNRNYHGRAWLLTSTPEGVGSLNSADARFSGSEEWMRAGFGLSGVGDLDGDGLSEIAISAPYATGADGEYSGSVFLYFSPLRGGLETDEADRVLSGQADEGAGLTMDLLPEFDGDGLSDLIIGASGASDRGDSSGGAYLLLGSGRLLSGTPGP